MSKIQIEEPKSKGEAQKNSILLVARKMFYERGYNNTRIEDIAAACYLTKPMVFYYYDSKSNLASAVYHQYIYEINNKLSHTVYRNYNQIDDNFNVQLSYALHVRTIYTMYLEDEHVSAFMDERTDDKMLSLWTGGTRFFKAQDRQYGQIFNEDIDEIKMASIGAPVASFAVAKAFLQGKIKCTKDDCLDYIIAINSKFLNISHERTSELQKGSKTMMKKLNIKIYPYFTIHSGK